MPLAARNNGQDKLMEVLYLRELPDRRVVWARATADEDANPEDAVLDLLASIQTVEKPGWGYDSAVAAAGSVLAALAGDPVTAFYRANNGRRDFLFTDADGQRDGTGSYICAIQSDGMLTHSEQVDIGPDGQTLKLEKICKLRAELSAFQVKDTTLRGDDGSLLIDSSRTDAASPVPIRIKFGRTAPVEGALTVREPFLPDPATDAATWYVAGKPGTTVLFRSVGANPEVPESILMTGFGRQHMEVNGRQIDALACLVQEDTSSGPNVALFEERGKLIGYVFPGGASLLRTSAAAESEPATTQE
jgi:hypothetical protein